MTNLRARLEINAGVDDPAHIVLNTADDQPEIGADQVEPMPDAEICTDPCDMPDFEEISMFELRTRLQKNRQIWDSDEQKKKRSSQEGKEEKQQEDPKPLTQESKWRHIFEATFKGLSGQRSDRDGHRRTRSQSTSEYLSVTTENVDDETMRQNAAIIPPFLMDGSAGLVTSKCVVHHGVAEKEKQRIRDFEASWSQQDVDKFKSRLSVVGKNFAHIAMFFPDKTVKDCVECYYLIIKRYNPDYKHFIPSPIQTRKYRPPSMPTPASLALYENGNYDISLYGFTNQARCYKCQQVLDTTKDTARVTRGLVDAENDVLRDSNVQRICGNCYEEELKRRINLKNAKIKKPGKELASRWKALNSTEKVLLRQEIARDITFACTVCNRKLLERVDLLITNHNDENICCQRHFPGGNQLKLTSGIPRNKILLENIDKFLYETWNSQKVRNYKVPKRSHIAVSFPYAKTLNENDSDVIFEHCLNFVRLYEPECGTLPAIDLVSTILFPEIMIRSAMIEHNIGYNDAYLFLTDDHQVEIKRQPDGNNSSCFIYNANSDKIELAAGQQTVGNGWEEFIDVENI